MIAKINLTEDNEILKSVMQMLDFQEQEDVYVLNDAQISAIEEAREQYKNGQYSTHEEVQKEIKKWLKK